MQPLLTMSFPWMNQRDDGRSPHSSITDSDTYTDTDTDTDTVTESKMDATYRGESTIGVLPPSRPGEASELWDLDRANVELDRDIRDIWHCFILAGSCTGVLTLLFIMLYCGRAIVQSLQGDLLLQGGVGKVVLVVVSYVDATAQSLREGASTAVVLVAEYYDDDVGRL
ncbi:hypothetical protein V502_02050 [Pseudogymnoascus sp. VKM F-4520 (FW-2644)]|nr:hypothetical protein V502_02050 [Pseudogymnoascus sp. VKM F-4520 (FW-2644)]